VNLVGREAEATYVAQFLEGGSGALLLDGEAGIGKTSVWLAGLESARRRGLRTLVARPAEAETQLPYATLADLLDPVADVALRLLPVPQRHALEVALVRRKATTAWDSRTVASATRAALTELSADEPTLLAIDDVQWVDAASADALAYAFRRSLGTKLRLLGTRRIGVEARLEVRDCDWLTITPLGPDDLAEIVRARLGLDLRRHALLRLAERSGGNPFFALELARDGRLFADADAPLPSSLEGILADRLRAAPRDVRDALLVAAAHGAPTVELLESVGVEPDALQRAAELDLLTPVGDELRFSHPLIASSVYGRATTTRRRDAHRRLAAAVDDPVARAFHLSQATQLPDAEVAAELESASERVAARSAQRAAAELLAHAVRLTPATAREDRRRRIMTLADLLFATGAHDEARGLLEQLVAELEPGPKRAWARVRLAECLFDDVETAIAMLEDALEEADPSGRAEALLFLANIKWGLGDMPEARRLYEECARVAEQARDRERQSNALTWLAILRMAVGEGLDEEAFRTAKRLRGVYRGPLIYDNDPAIGLATWQMVVGDVERARPVLDDYRKRAIELGDDVVLAHILALLAFLECEAGSAEEAETLVASSIELARQIGEPRVLVDAVIMGARVRARLGNVEQAQADADETLALAAPTGAELLRVSAVDVLGFLALSLDQLDQAVDHLEHVFETIERMPWREPGPLGVHHNLPEVYVRRGELEKAETLLEQVEAIATPIDRVRTLAGIARVRGMIAAERGDADGAIALLQESLAIQARLPEPIESGRTLLVLGTVLRRANRKRAAHETLEEAVRTLDGCGARIWAEQARAELGRISGRPLRAGELTATENRIAELVAAGRTNHDVARAVSLSPRTVEWNLSKIYRKLHVRSRGELAAKLAKRADTA
jgi:tetratricopeptide (TPR) repeat protein